MRSRSCLRNSKVGGSLLRFQVILENGILGPCRRSTLLVCLKDLKLDGNGLRFEVVVEIEARGVLV